MLLGGWRNFKKKKSAAMSQEDYDKNIAEYNEFQSALKEGRMPRKKFMLSKLTVAEGKKVKSNIKKKNTKAKSLLKVTAKTWVDMPYDVDAGLKPDGKLLKAQAPKEFINFGEEPHFSIVKLLNKAGYKFTGRNQKGEYVFQLNAKKKAKRKSPGSEYVFFANFVRRVGWEQYGDKYTTKDLGAMYRDRNGSEQGKQNYADYLQSPEHAQYLELKAKYGKGLGEFLAQYFPETRKSLKSFAHGKIEDWLGASKKKKKRVEPRQNNLFDE